jgi:hypothetical protein
MREPVEYCDCGHRKSAHQNPAVGNQPGRCLHCLCEGWHERNVWVTDDRPKRGES